MSPDDLRRVGTTIGFPWDRLAEAQALMDDAANFAQLAIEEGNPETIEIAEFELETAVIQYRHARRSVGDAFILMFRCALEASPVEMRRQLIDWIASTPWVSAIEEHVSSQAGSFSWFLRHVTEIEKRVDAAEYAIVDLEGANATR